MGYEWDIPSGNLTELWKITILNGKIHYFDTAIFNSYVKLPEGIIYKYMYNKFVYLRNLWSYHGDIPPGK